MIKHAVNGISVNDNTLAVEVIQDVGPAGNFLVHHHTVQHMRSQSQPEFIDRTMREVWERKGSCTAYDRAMDKVKNILETHIPEPLPQDVMDKIRAIVIETEKEMGIKKKGDAS
jgi:trimethylamine--corrinoid protein Co-methyltransferase